MIKLPIRSAFLCLCLLSMPLCAEDEPVEGEEGAAPVATAIYIPFKPAFVVNYGGQGRLKYLKAEVSVRVQDTPSAEVVRHHMPLLRNSLVLLFSNQTDADLATQEGKEILRQSALERVNTLLEAEEGESGVVDLFFSNLIIQK